MAIFIPLRVLLGFHFVAALIIVYSGNCVIFEYSVFFFPPLLSFIHFDFFRMLLVLNIYIYITDCYFIFLCL